MDKEFMVRLAEILEIPTEKISREMKLPTDLWDSLAILAVAAAFDTVFDKVVPVKTIEKCTTVQELLSLAEGNE